MEVNVTSQTALVNEPKAWHTVSDAEVSGADQVRVNYLRVTAKQVTTAYTEADRYSFNATMQGGLHSIPDNIPASVLAQAAQEVADYVESKQ